MYNNIIPLIIGEILFIGILITVCLRLRVKKMKKYHSPLSGEISIRQEPNGEKRLVMNYCVQGISIEQPTIDQSYWGKIAKIAPTLIEASPGEILHIGLGANTIPRLIAKNNPAIHQTLIEIDPVVITACKEFFELDSLPNSTVVIADLFKLLEEKDDWNNHFDSIITDIFTGKPSEYTPAEGKYDHIKKLTRWIKPNGHLLIIRPAHIETAIQDVENLEKFLKTNYKEVSKEFVKDPRGFINYILIVNI